MYNFCLRCGSEIDKKTGICPKCSYRSPHFIPSDGNNQQNKKVEDYSSRLANNSQPPKNEPINKEWQKTTPNTPVNKEKKKSGCGGWLILIIILSIVFGIFMMVGKDDAPTGNITDNNYANNNLVSSANYEVVIEQYEELIRNDFYRYDRDYSGTKLYGEYVSNGLVFNTTIEEPLKVYYALFDINKDGVQELVIGYGDSSNDSVAKYDIFTHDGIKPVSLFGSNTFERRTGFTLFDNGIIHVFSTGSNPAMSSAFYTLPNKSSVVKKEVEYTCEYNGFFVTDDNGKRSITETEYTNAVEQYDNRKVQLNWIEIKVNNANKTEALTEKQINDFEKFLNDNLYAFSETSYVTVDSYINSFICYGLFGSPQFGLYQYFFPNQVTEVTTDPLGKSNQFDNCYEFDADKVLFIINDVFGFNLTGTESYDNYYFYNGKFYYIVRGAGGSIVSYNYEVDNVETITNGYYKVQVTQKELSIYDGTIENTRKVYYEIKPCNHSKYGDYWSIRSIS